MFSSNQVLAISGKMEQLGSALAFALDYSGFSELIDDPERKTHIVYQIAQDGCFCIGYAFDEPKEGWRNFSLVLIESLWHRLLKGISTLFLLRNQIGAMADIEKDS